MTSRGDSREKGVENNRIRALFCTGVKGGGTRPNKPLPCRRLPFYKRRRVPGGVSRIRYWREREIGLKQGTFSLIFLAMPSTRDLALLTHWNETYSF